jgi:hypothetical protein
LFFNFPRIHFVIKTLIFKECAKEPQGASATSRELQAGGDRRQAGGTRIQRCAGHRQEVRSVQDYLYKLVKLNVRQEGRASSVAQAPVRKSGQFRTATAFSGQFRTISASW